MTRTVFLAAVLICGTCPMATGQIIFEDPFDGPTLDPTWVPMGTGSYSLVGGDLEFFTEQGDYVDAYEDQYGPPRHVFYVDPGSGVTEWAAMTRVRQTAPGEPYEQVALIAYQDNDTYAKFAYYAAAEGRRWGALAEWDGNRIETTFSASLQTDYFWMMLARHGDTYSGYWSGDATTDPNQVDWIHLTTQSVPLTDPMVGIGGWNGTSYPSGELSEFDYFNVQVPEPLTASTLIVGGLALLRRRRP